MTRKLTTAWATVYVATVTGITMASTGLKKLETNKELTLTNPPGRTPPLSVSGGAPGNS
jgi:hypothetical protein